jgi:hypothetical protein
MKYKEISAEEIECTKKGDTKRGVVFSIQSLFI